MRYLSSLFCVWVGLIIGLSFIATPAKFLAPSVSLAQALQIGSVTFGVFQWVELAMLCLGILFCLKIGVRASVRGVVALVGGILAVQYLLLLPAMDLRVVAIGEGVAVDASLHHHVYVALELLEVTLLVVGSMLAAKDSGAECPPDENQLTGA